MEHTPLRKRKNVLSHDVADAFELLVGPTDGSTLPLAFTKMQVVDQLVDLANMDEDGIVQEIIPFMREAALEKTYNRLSNTAVFQAGYRRYEERSANPTVPVTDYFFKIVYGENDSLDSHLGEMTDEEIVQSLPKRIGRVKLGEQEDGTIEYLRGEHGEVLEFGQLAGVVIFPPHSSSPLLRAWLHRRAKTASGVLRSTVNRIAHAKPDAETVAELKEKTQMVPSAMMKALPRPKRRR